MSVYRIPQRTEPETCVFYTRFINIRFSREKTRLFLTENLIGYVGQQVNPPVEGGAVPEPSTYGLIGAGALVALAIIRRRKA